MLTDLPPRTEIIRNPTLYAVGLLLLNPRLAQHADSPDVFAHLQGEAAQLLRDILSLLHKRPESNTHMLLGHWYLNTPTMKLAPLKQLIIWMVIAVILRCGVSWSDLGSIPQLLSAGRSTLLAFLALRWLAGLLGILGLSGMTWQTLKIPNTQSATGILYVAVIFAFLGELTAQLLSLDSTYPV